MWPRFRQLLVPPGGRLLQPGFWPDTISTDLHHQNVTGPAIDLLYVASKFLAMGMPLQDVLYRVTRAPALSIHHPELARWMWVPAQISLCCATAKVSSATWTAAVPA